MTYPQALSYLDSLTNFEKKGSSPAAAGRVFKLERMTALLACLGNPHTSLRCIHIAGTKGKGSTAAYAAYMLRRCGYRTGLYTSPHLADLRERIRVLKPGGRAPSGDFAGMISRAAFAGLLSDVRPKIDAFNRAGRFGQASFFEVLTCMAFEYFRRELVDLVVLETGLGGRLDATNTVRPLICAITPISHDHQDVLGTGLAAIAAEKAGIIKPASRSYDAAPLIVLSAGQPASALAVVRRACARHGARLAVIGSQLRIAKAGVDAAGGSFSLDTPWGALGDLRVPLAGEHQVVNAGLAVSLLLALRSRGSIRASDAQIRSGLRESRWPGRLETVSVKPLILLDGAHNRESALALARSLRSLYVRAGKVLVLGISADKDAAAICRALLPVFDKVVVTRADHPRALGAEALYTVAKRYWKPGQGIVVAAASLPEALAQARRICGRGDMIVVCGSLFLVAQARGLLR